MSGVVAFPWVPQVSGVLLLIQVQITMCMLAPRPTGLLLLLLPPTAWSGMPAVRDVSMGTFKSTGWSSPAVSDLKSSSPLEKIQFELKGKICSLKDSTGEFHWWGKVPTGLHFKEIPPRGGDVFQAPNPISAEQQGLLISKGNKSAYWSWCCLTWPVWAEALNCRLEKTKYVKRGLSPPNSCLSPDHPGDAHFCQNFLWESVEEILSSLQLQMTTDTSETSPVAFAGSQMLRVKYLIFC